MLTFDAWITKQSKVAIDDMNKEELIDLLNGYIDYQDDMCDMENGL